MAGLEVGLTVLLIGVVLAVALAFYLVTERNEYAVAVNEANAAAGKAVEH